MLTACICVAAIVWQSSSGDAARQIITRWSPQLVSTTSLPLQNPAPRAAEPTYRSDGLGAGNISTSSTFVSDRTGRRRADRRRPVARVDAVAPADGARSHNREARN